MIEEAARAWALELTRAATDLSCATHRLQAAFVDCSAKSLTSGGEPIPDPIKLLRRLSALEASLLTLRSESQEISKRRSELVPQVVETLSKNVLSIRKISMRADGSHTQNVIMGDETWGMQAVQVAKQYRSYSEKKNTPRLNEMSNDTAVDASESFSGRVLGMSTSLSSVPLSDGTDIHALAPVITDESFLSISPSVRGRAKIEHVRQVASAIYQVHKRRYESGARGRALAMTKQQILDFTSPTHAFRNASTNSALWPKIVSSLEEMGIIQVSSNSLLYKDRTR